MILFTGGGVCLSACWDTTHPPGADTPTSPRADTPLEQTPPESRHSPLGADTPPGADPPGTRQPPRNQVHPLGLSTPPRTKYTPPGTKYTPPGSRLRHTVNERPVRILLECILVVNDFKRILSLCNAVKRTDAHIV